MNFKQYRLFIILALVTLAVIFRFVYLGQFFTSPLFTIPLGPDVEEYDSWARQILAGKIIWDSVPIHAPLYSYFLASIYSLFSLNLYAVRAFQELLGLSLVFPVYFVVEHLTRSDKKIFGVNDSLLPCFFFALWALYPPFIYYQAELISEALLLPLLSLAIYFLYLAEDDYQVSVSGQALSNNHKPYPLFWFSLAGFFMGMAVVTHPASLIFLVLEMVYLLYRIIQETRSNGFKKSGWERIVFLMVFALLWILPVSLYNSSIEKQPVLVQKNSGFNLYLGNNPEADGTCYLRPGPAWDKFHAEAENAALEKNMSKDKYLTSKTFEFYWNEPLTALKLFLTKAVYVWNYRELPSGADVGSLRFFAQFQAFTWWSFGVLGVLSLCGLIFGLSRMEFIRRYRHFLILMLAFFMVQVVFVTSARYRLAMLPGMFLTAAFTLNLIVGKIKNFRFISGLIIAMLVCSMLVFMPSPSVKVKLEEAEACSIMGEAFMKRGMYPEAQSYIRKALTLQNDWSRNYDLYGTILGAQGINDGALAMFQKAAELDPKSWYSLMNIGILYSRMGKPEKADEYFKKALELNSEASELYYNLAYFQYKYRKVDAAEQNFLRALQLNPANRQCLNAMGFMMMMKHKFSDAVKYFYKAHTLEPLNSQIMVNLSAAYLAEGNIDKAEHWLEKALELTPELEAAVKMKERLGSK
jgi:Flp pilus assembly protein TadD